MHFKGTAAAGIGQGIRLTTYHGLLVAWAELRSGVACVRCWTRMSVVKEM